MDFWVGVTDNQWYESLAEQRADEVNFWRPTPQPPSNHLKLGTPFLFKLKSPFQHIAGGGYFVSYMPMPIWLAWEIFQDRNGYSSLSQMIEGLSRYREFKDANSLIGCITLSSVFYFAKEDWVSRIPGWASNIVTGKGYELASYEGEELWRSLQPLLGEQQLSLREEPLGQMAKTTTQTAIHADTLRRWTKQRIGQSGFRVLVTEAYHQRCAITGESTLATLEAAHIVPFSRETTHDVRNGMLLRADFHRLYDLGLVSVTPDLKVRISPKIHEQSYNGKAYYRLDNQPLSVVPDRHDFSPDPDRLAWHYDNLFQRS
ncbi:MAG: HNH endonuclease [Ferrimicrobium sp.]